MGRPARAKGGSVLHVVAALFLASAVLRISTEAGPALAQTAQSRGEVALAEVPQVDDDDTFFAALRAREASLDQREAQIDEKLKIMEDAQVDLETQMLALLRAEEALQSTIAMAETASQSDVAQLTSVYENMKPKEAAALFEEMSPDFAAGFLGLMRPDVAASIMTELTPETAYSFSVVLAGRNANTPTQ
jgi:flagellar motility protein MotE (MotC chaperone)